MPKVKRVRTPPRAPVTDDIVVTKEALMRDLNLKIAESTFRKYVSNGIISKARNIGHRYLLNQTRSNMGLPLLDIKEYRDKETQYAAVYRTVWLIFHVACECQPSFVNFPPYCPEPEVYFPEDLKKYDAIKRRLDEWVELYGKGDPYLLTNVLHGTDLMGEFIAPLGEELMTPRLRSLSKGLISGPPPTRHPKQSQ